MFGSHKNLFFGCIFAAGLLVANKVFEGLLRQLFRKPALDESTQRQLRHFDEFQKHINTLTVDNARAAVLALLRDGKLSCVPNEGLSHPECNCLPAAARQLLSAYHCIDSKDMCWRVALGQGHCRDRVESHTVVLSDEYGGTFVVGPFSDEVFEVIGTDRDTRLEPFARSIFHCVLIMYSDEQDELTDGRMTGLVPDNEEVEGDIRRSRGT